MKIDVKIPEVGESVQEALLVEWYRKDGDRVHKDQILFLIETDKVTLEVVAEADGILHILVPEGETVAVGAVVATIETEAEAGKGGRPDEPGKDERPGRAQKKGAEVREGRETGEKTAADVSDESPERDTVREESREPREELNVAPSARRLMEEKGVSVSAVKGSGPGGRITLGDVKLHLEEMESGERGDEGGGLQKPEKRDAADMEAAAKQPEVSKGTRAPSEPEMRGGREKKASPAGGEEVVRKPMSPIRRRIAEHLVHARQSTAMLTTFNEVDMTRVQALRREFREVFRERYGVSLGIMSFFIKAAIVALKEIPEVNAFIDGKDILYHQYYHVGVAVGAERGLVVPVIRHADALSFAEIEQTIGDFVTKIRENKLELSHLDGGTFTISNGGVYGSLLSTPILNTPQSGILGLHKIEDRPVVVDGQIVVRPMMYVALSYDHRIIDGREAVTFLKRIKECIEHPERIMIEI